ncbi:sugar phosphate isomerase/epimerase family protein [Aporhodopirellula aestuarii]|uniref:Sugar phosphate isomerase/epimerase n=1 Tax=Aporhodopirellula aestuarii TaxID=2950107 RepID=A0ABT0TX68_9BACT|nr:sugar phosphate isomerase/epimerase family protein [Aporhodopirellula aestuarii]MCM2369184.1 sugar phosphate isomerase/epimerase [Aporhodopirellula aestuarii]
MIPLSRRHLLQTFAAAMTAGVALPIHANERFRRINPRIKGISLSAYSLRPHMQWWKGKRTSGKMDMLGFLDYCADLGVEAAELTSYFFPAPLDKSYLNKVKRRAHVLGIDISGGAMGNSFAYEPQSEEGRSASGHFRSWIDHFADLGAPAVRVFASSGKPKQATEEQVIENVVANLEIALPYAEKRGVMLGLENHDILKNIDHLVRILGQIDSPWLGVTWDSANLEPTPDPYAELARIAPYAITAQLKVMTNVNGKPTPADLPRLLQILKDAQFSGYVVLEYEEKEDPYEAIPKFLTQARTAIASMD